MFDGTTRQATYLGSRAFFTFVLQLQTSQIRGDWAALIRRRAWTARHRGRDCQNHEGALKHHTQAGHSHRVNLTSSHVYAELAAFRSFVMRAGSFGMFIF